MEIGGAERDAAEEGSPAANRTRDGGQSAAPARNVIRWENFLPRRSLRVLLVESDDSTRHIVTALLRKCNYRVAGVADGMKAWEVIKEKRYSFDLVLTEVAMPSLSGIGLLTKIMTAEECKNVPVIMMSTHDSINVVLKCMLKGAVDFLVKPVRKNELRNLWQHVWRRHHSNKCQTDNNTASNQISANVDGRSRRGENSDERSDAQSSGCKKDIEIESIHGEPSQSGYMNVAEQEANPDASNEHATIRATVSDVDVGSARDHKPAGVRVNIGLPIQGTSGAHVSTERNRVSGSSGYREGNLAFMPPTDGDKDDHVSLCQNNALNVSVKNMVVFVEPITNGQCSYAVLEKDALMEDGLPETAKSSHVDDASHVGTSPLWELSLRRPQLNGCIQPELKEKHVLKRSVASAFTRYGEKRTQKSASTDLCVRTRAFVEEYQTLLSSHGTYSEENTSVSHTDNRTAFPRGNIGETAVHLHVSSATKENTRLPSPAAENECAGHSLIMEDTTALPCPQFSFIPLPIPVGPIPYQSLSAGFRGLLQPVFYTETSLAPQNSAAFGKSVTQIPSADHSVLPNNQLIQHSSSLDLHRHDITFHHSHWRKAMDISERGDSRELCSRMDQAYHNGSCSQDVLKGSGSNGSGDTADGIANACVALESGNEGGIPNCDGKALDCDRSRREAALIKFRMKRKDRCFEKKVRYYSRKKLAEERPRIKGQFVRQKFPESMAAAEGDN